MLNAELSRIFDRIADLMEIGGGDSFRISSYRRAARTLKDTTEDVAVLAEEGRLTDLPGVGKGTAERIAQYIKTGHIEVLDELEKKFPKGLVELLEIPGMGPKKVALVHGKLGVKNLDDLKRVIESGEMEELKGLGATSVKKIAEGIAFLERSGTRTPLGLALSIAEAFAQQVGGLPGVRRVEIAGSLRRGEETIGDIDLLCEAQDGEAVIERFTKVDGVKRILASGETKGSVTVQTDEGREVQVDLRVVPSESFGAAWQYFTGSKAHNVRLREMAVKRKWRLNEYGLFDGPKAIAGKSEEEIYKKLGVKWVPPELRQDRGELEKGADFENLVTLAGIRGDLHMHTKASDGRSTIEEMAEAGKALGYEYIAICDHSRSATIANGLSVERMRKHIKDIRAAGKRVSGIEILVGCECDILADGTMDYPDDLLAACDWVVGSIHTAAGAGRGVKLSPTQRTVKAMENRWVSAIGHPTGRLIHKRAAMELDIEAVVKAAVETHTLLEINASWQRLDLKDLHVRQVLSGGEAAGVGVAMLVIDTGAHHTDQLTQMRLGVTTARRGGARTKDVANTLTAAGLMKRIAKKRG
jgi:DNA polymerase (family 10)